MKSQSKQDKQFLGNHPPFPWLGVRVKVRDKFIFSFMGGEGGWFPETWIDPHLFWTLDF